MRQLFCIMYVTTIGAVCTFAAVYLESSSFAAIFMGVAAFVCFLVAMGCVAQYGSFRTDYDDDDPDDAE